MEDTKGSIDSIIAQSKINEGIAVILRALIQVSGELCLRQGMTLTAHTLQELNKIVKELETIESEYVKNVSRTLQ